MTTDAKVLRMRMLHRLHAVIAFDRTTVGDPRQPPDTLASAYGSLNAANAGYLRTAHAFASDVDAWSGKP